MPYHYDELLNTDADQLEESSSSLLGAFRRLGLGAQFELESSMRQVYYNTYLLFLTVLTTLSQARYSEWSSYLFSLPELDLNVHVPAPSRSAGPWKMKSWIFCEILGPLSTRDLQYLNFR